jgi:hypothetical protein
MARAVVAALGVMTALTVVNAPRAVSALVVAADEPSLLEPADEPPVPLSEIVIESRAVASVKSAFTVSAIVPVAAVEVR